MSRDAKSLLGMLPLLLASAGAVGGEVAIEHARFVQSGNAWLVSVTLRHADTGWDHYADAWRVVDGEGRQLGQRKLYHPHVTEQPFTRSERIVIPPGVRQVFVEAHDTVHGLSSQRLAVDLGRQAGPGYEIVHR